MTFRKRLLSSVAYMFLFIFGVMATSVFGQNGLPANLDSDPTDADGVGKRIRPGRAYNDRGSQGQLDQEPAFQATRSDQGKQVRALENRVKLLEKALKEKIQNEVVQEQKQKLLENQEKQDEGKLYREKADELDGLISQDEKQLQTETLRQMVEKKFATAQDEEPSPFGASFFTEGEDISGSLENIPVPSSYRLGSGDSLKIIVWSEMGDETVYDVTVNPEGQVYIPIIGVLGVHGQTVGQFEQLVLGSLAGKFKHFKGQVTLTKVRTLQIFVTGEVVKPGAQIVSALSTAFHALYRAGGPSEKGSMRTIQLLRNGKIVGDVDLYRYFLRGDKSQDLALETGDTILVPSVGRRVTVKGEVIRPATFEILNETTLEQVLEMAGGAEPSAYSRRLKIYRWQGGDRRKILDIEQHKIPGDFQLQDGDEVEAERATEEIGNRAIIEGPVQRPGEYAVSSGITLSKLIERAGGLIREEAAPQAGQIIRKLPSGREGILSFNLEKALAKDPRHDLPILALDRIKLFRSQDIEANIKMVTIAGAVRRPGEYILREGMRVRDLILRARGLSIDASDELEVARVGSQGAETEVRRVDISKILKNESDEDNMVLRPLDRVSVLARGDTLIEPEVVILKGEVKRPGPYALKRRGETLAELIQRAGGLTGNAFPDGTIFKRRADKLFDEQQLKIAETVQDEMFAQASLDLKADLLRNGAKVSDLGGAETQTNLATSLNLENTLNADTTAVEEIANLRDKGVGKESSAFSEVKISSRNLQEKMYRVPIHSEMLGTPQKRELSMALLDGDMITIPTIPPTISVVGAVVNPSSILYQENRGLSYYINRVGGFNSTANHRRSVVVRANGEVLPMRRVKKVCRGDIILVPPKAKLVRPSMMQETGQIAQILGNLAVVYKVAIQN